jgi:ribosomal protein S11
VNADEKKLVRIAQKNGATVEYRNTHARILDAQGNIVIRLSAGTSKAHDTRAIIKEWKRRGWM